LLSFGVTLRSMSLALFWNRVSVDSYEDLGVGPNQEFPEQRNKQALPPLAHNHKLEAVIPCRCVLGKDTQRQHPSRTNLCFEIYVFVQIN
jgi:hypothetical protein